MELISQTLIHSKFGKGTISDFASDIIAVKFDSGEYKVFSCLYALPFIKLENTEIYEELKDYVEQQNEVIKPVFVKNTSSEKLVSVDKNLSMNVINEKITSKVISDGLEQYMYIMKNFNLIDISKNIDFQRKFTYFYKVRRSKEEFLEKYYEYMESCKNKNISYEEVLKKLYTFQNKVEKSFASKLLHTINPDMPIWDSIVLKNLGLEMPTNITNINEKMTMSCNLYENIIKWYKEKLFSEDGRQTIGIFDITYPNSGISNTKKLDFILWGIRG